MIGKKKQEGDQGGRVKERDVSKRWLRRMDNGKLQKGEGGVKMVLVNEWRVLEDILRIS